MKGELCEKELWTQSEVANYFRVVPATIHNWRQQGPLKYFQAPGSTRVLFYRDDVIRFRDDNTGNKKGGEAKGKPKQVKGKPVVSAKSDDDWRI